MQECKDYVCRPALRILAEAATKGGLERFRPHELSRLIWAVASQSCWGSPGMPQQVVGSAQTTQTSKQDGHIGQSFQVKVGVYEKSNGKRRYQVMNVVRPCKANNQLVNHRQSAFPIWFARQFPTKVHSRLETATNGSSLAGLCEVPAISSRGILEMMVNGFGKSSPSMAEQVSG